MLFRDHKGSLADSMATVYYVRDREHFIEIMRERLTPWGRAVPDEALKIEPYGSGVDTRIEWNTHIVTLADYGVLGFTNGPLEDRLSETPAIRFREKLDSRGAQMESIKGVEDFADLVKILDASFSRFGRIVLPWEVTIGEPDTAPRPETWSEQRPVHVEGYGIAGWLTGPLAPLPGPTLA